MTKARKRKKTIFSFLLALSLILSAFAILSCSNSASAVTQWEIDQLKEKQEEIADQKSELGAEIDALEAEHASVMKRKAALDEQNELTRQEIELINEQIDLYEKLIEAKELELEQAIEAEREQIAAYRRHMRAMEEQGSIRFIEVLFQARSFSDLLSRMSDIHDIMTADKRLEAECIAARENVQLVKAEYEAAKAEYEAKKVELLERKAQLEKDIEAAYRLIAELMADIDSRREEYEELEAEMKEMDAKIAEMIQALKAQSIVGTGYYTWPLPGYSAGSRTFGTQFHPIDKVWKTHSGQDIGAPMNTPIVAADSGSVGIAANGWNGGYGNYVVINHGNGRATLYAHMNSIAVKAGSAVKKGDVIGYVGSTGKSTGPHLHFEVRVNGACVDPMQYFST